MHCLVLLLGFVLGKTHAAYQQCSLLGFVLGKSVIGTILATNRACGVLISLKPDPVFPCCCR
jgi:hypothetical protein